MTTIRPDPKTVTLIYILPFLAKSFTVDFFVLLPVLYAKHFITSAAVGYLGAVAIAMLVAGALIVTRWLHHSSSRQVVIWGSWLSLVSVLLLAAGISTHNLWVILMAYALSGLLVGFSTSATNALVADYTDRGNRYGVLARMSMLGDINRILFPLVVAGALALVGLNGALGVILLMSGLFIWASAVFPKPTSAGTPPVLPRSFKLRHNRSFRYFVSLEFFDSFASSQLFVFVPILFLAKGYSIGSSLVLQTAIFLGYLAGRWIISRLAGRGNATMAVGVAEAGMGICILLLLAVHSLVALYLLTFVLGVFARGTSPVIKALAFDSLHDVQMKRGSALHVVAGDSGSALGQLCFGLLLAAAGVKAPFLAAAGLAGLIALFCLPQLSSRLTVARM